MTRMMAMAAGAALLLGGCGPSGNDGNRASADGNAAAPDTAPSGAQSEAKQTLGQAIAQTQGLGRFAAALKGSGLDGVLSGASPYTVFAPNDAAFEKLGGEPQDKPKLTGLVTAHIVPGVVTAKDLQAAIDKGGGKAELATMSGANLTARRDGDAIVLRGASGGEARVVQADVMGSNGVAHVVDGVLQGK